MTTQTSGPRTTTLPAKQPATVVAGPYGHPFHPILVTIPIGAWVSSLVLDIGSHVVSHPAGLMRGAYWLIAIGVIGALLAALFGLLDLLTIPRGTRAFKAALAHMTLNLSIVGLFIVSFAVRHSDGLNAPTKGAALALSAIAIGLLLVSGWIGGMLSYRYGVRVAQENTQVDGYNT